MSPDSIYECKGKNYHPQVNIQEVSENGDSVTIVATCQECNQSITANVDFRGVDCWFE